MPALLHSLRWAVVTLLVLRDNVAAVKGREHCQATFEKRQRLVENSTVKLEKPPQTHLAFIPCQQYLSRLLLIE